MKAFSPLHLLPMVAIASTTYMCPVSPGSSDAPAIVYGYVLQNLLSSYYDSVPINKSFYSSLPSPTKPMTDFLANTMGLAVQAKLGEEALLQAGMAAGGMKPNCSFSYPPVTDANSHLMNAYIFEATMCGAFIGLADYTQSPQAAFLMARLAAEHGEKQASFRLSTRAMLNISASRYPCIIHRLPYEACRIPYQQHLFDASLHARNGQHERRGGWNAR
jgi:hypothetical protein